MSIYSRIKAEQPAEPISKDETPFYMSNTNEGFERLIFEESEILYEEGGHKFIFYPKGVLLSLKDNCRFHQSCDSHNGSKSYIFFNNNGELVLDIYNSTREKAPEKDIDITVYKSFILVEETDLRTGQKFEYFVSIKTGEKIIDVGNNNTVDNIEL